MDCCVTGAVIRTLRERLGMTQAELAEKICVSDKTVSKWETGRGFPDVSLLEPLGSALQVSVRELLCGPVLQYDEEPVLRMSCLRERPFRERGRSGLMLRDTASCAGGGRSRSGTYA